MTQEGAPLEPLGCYITNEAECEECLCYDNAQIVEVECECDPGAVCPDCPAGYFSIEIVPSDCDVSQSPCTNGNGAKRICVQKLEERDIIACSDLGPADPTCYGDVVNPGEFLSGYCGTFFADETCDTVDCSEVGGLSIPRVKVLSQPSGPGTELKALLAKIGIHASPTCGCNKMAKKMDAWGQESLNHIEEIVDVMEDTAKKRKLPFLRTAGRILVRQACRLARKKANNK
jgi:hypothetical protein